MASRSVWSTARRLKLLDGLTILFLHSSNVCEVWTSLLVDTPAVRDMKYSLLGCQHHFGGLLLLLYTCSIYIYIY